MASLTMCFSRSFSTTGGCTAAPIPFVCRKGSIASFCTSTNGSLRRQGFLCVRAMEISGPGSIESALINSMTVKLKEQLNTEDVIVKDAYGDGRHVSIEVVSAEFEGKTSVNRQRMVYKAIWEELQTTVHAVDSMRTLTPDEAAQEKLQSST
ncbi:hypothetical protein KP509_24G005800 [Ceratopteris richardii]|uniref:Uncharacterized protein n=1 Tax=Ceratopteris richardii TaxID=49495 RepID=A0A8T2RSC9_CERRI|nr:hypothetical protein KP509_24G005800 [Ceratopteris richardii]